MRQSRSSGSVGARPSNRPLYPDKSLQCIHWSWVFLHFVRSQGAVAQMTTCGNSGWKSEYIELPSTTYIADSLGLSRTSVSATAPQDLTSFDCPRVLSERSANYTRESQDKENGPVVRRMGATSTGSSVRHNPFRRIPVGGFPSWPVVAARRTSGLRRPWLWLGRGFGRYPRRRGRFGPGPRASRDRTASLPSQCLPT